MNYIQTKLWIWYFWLVLVWDILFHVVRFMLFPNSGIYLYGFIFISIIEMTGLFGFAFRKKILSQTLWKVAFFIVLAIFAHGFFYESVIDYLNNELDILGFLFVVVVQLPFIPLYLALYLYAWKSNHIWESGTARAQTSGAL